MQIVEAIGACARRAEHRHAGAVILPHDDRRAAGKTVLQWDAIVAVADDVMAE